MEDLPDEILIDILDYLGFQDVVSAQQISTRLLKLARDNSLWRYKCFENAPSAAALHADRHETLTALTGALGGLSISPRQRTQKEDSVNDPLEHPDFRQAPRISKRAKAVTEWDNTGDGEEVDWYSEFVGRSAQLSVDWLSGEKQEIRGVASHDSSNKVVGCLEDGSICVWDVREQRQGRRKFAEIARSSCGALFEDQSSTSGGSSRKSTNLAFSGVVECINVDSARNKAFVAVEEVLNEVDLNTLQVISQTKYAWPITALSKQEEDLDLSLTVGTTWSLHLYDPRVPLRDRSRSPEDLLRSNPGVPEDSIAFLPNYSKSQSISQEPENVFRPLHTGPAPNLAQLSSQHWRRPRAFQRLELSDYAHVEPGPLSILHNKDNEILVAGRFPSILSYDRRYFPRLQYVMHSGARLSSLSIIPHPPKAIQNATGINATLIACGEYGGRGSLELYSLPHLARDPSPRASGPDLTEDLETMFTSDAERSYSEVASRKDHPFSYKNRQEASSAKLLSVATQGSRIVFSDAEGGLKWVERDGRGLARRWNINSYELNERGASISGELVARKIIGLKSEETDRGARGDGDLLIWTGENIGIVTTKRQWTSHDELVKAFEEKLDLREIEEKQQADEYSKAMRQALELQADERRWMSRFRLKRGLY